MIGHPILLKKEDIDSREILRYLGYGKNSADERVMGVIGECVDLILEAVQLRWAWLRLPLTIQGSNLNIGGEFKIESESLSKNMAGSVETVLFAATLGAGVDRLLQRYSRQDVAYAAALQAGATAIIEMFCDRCQSEIQSELEKEGLATRPRFSPGYGDFSLEHQRNIFRLLDCPAKLGLTLTDTLIMAPSKSVTAVMGAVRLEDEEVKKRKEGQNGQGCRTKGCEECDKTDCSFRRD